MKDIVINNSIIAEFLGWERHNTEFIIPVNLYRPQSVREFESMVYDCRVDFTDLEFHCSWDWLMLAIEKISKYEYGREIVDGVVHINYAYPITFGMIDEHGYYMFRFKNQPLFNNATLLGAVWEAVVYFIMNNFHEKKETN